MGTDQFGRDTFSRAVAGAQVSLAVGAVTVILALAIGVPMGALAGYGYGTRLDDAIMRVMDILLAFPPIILAIAVIAALGTEPLDLGVVTVPHITKLLFVIGILYAPQVARVTRSAVLVERNEQYVLAEQALGAGHTRILFRDVLRNCVSPVSVHATVLVANAIIAEASLSFLGLGIQPPQPSWGVMLSDAKTYVTSGEWWLTVFPGVLIFVTVCSLNILGDFLRDVLDPRELTRGGHG
jgi:peptide/nickel transport system permease protein